MKKIWIGIFVFVILSSAGGIFYWQVASKKTQMPEVSVSITPTPTPEELATWLDPNGFQFQYPKNLKIDAHDEDNLNYAHIEFTNPDHPGSVIVWGKDTKAADSAAWVKGEKLFTGAVVLDTTLGEKSGKKVLVETPEKKIISAVVDEGVVFYIEGDLKDSDYWTDIHTTISSTFAFTYNKIQNSQSGASDEEVAVDEEEVVE